MVRDGPSQEALIIRMTQILLISSPCHRWYKNYIFWMCVDCNVHLPFIYSTNHWCRDAGIQQLTQPIQLAIRKYLNLGNLQTLCIYSSLWEVYSQLTADLMGCRHIVEKAKYLPWSSFVRAQVLFLIALHLNIISLGMGSNTGIVNHNSNNSNNHKVTLSPLWNIIMGGAGDK